MVLCRSPTIGGQHARVERAVGDRLGTKFELVASVSLAGVLLDIDRKGGRK